MNTALPLWVDVLTGVLVLLGAFVTMVGSLGLVRLKSFFQRVHAPTLGATVGTGAVSLAVALQFSFLRAQLFAHALLIGLFVVVTVPVTTVFLMRAALFRLRIKGDPEAPPSVTGTPSSLRPSPGGQREG